ncbi:MAG: DUF2304 family protein [Candidatus Omnitrophica bacterium]|nr:DUF2304 family protein [Candidatus Omnitrophota bacterium]
MQFIQFIIILFAIFALTGIFIRFRRKTINFLEFFLWSFFWFMVGLCVSLPNITQWFAKILGVGRGADAVFYIGIVSLSYFLFRLYIKIRHIEQEITHVVRKLALNDLEHTKK